MKEAQYQEVEALLLAAFETDAEARLVQQLPADGDMLMEFQKPWAGRIGGSFARSGMQAPQGWARLAQMAVWQPMSALPDTWEGSTRAYSLPPEAK